MSLDLKEIVDLLDLTASLDPPEIRVSLVTLDLLVLVGPQEGRGMLGILDPLDLLVTPEHLVSLDQGERMETLGHRGLL